ncbi:hypothetical protein [Catellatospora sichuanensis]|uniref:hypothetical protein n=1 Tax=Catellatospora sichuanensis TaxID=1969805 RepID=UPI001FEAA978|nr:hypothetical protein [Catellatospora sichuanensis]
MTAKPGTVTMPGQVWGLAAADPAGPMYVTSYDDRDTNDRYLDTTVLTAVDLAGATIWQRSFAGHPYSPRVDPDGTIWIAHRETAGSDRCVFTAVDSEGVTLRSVVLQHDPPECVGAFVRMPNGFCVVWLPTSRFRQVPEGGTARLARYHDTGDILWSTPLPLSAVSFPGVVEAGVHTAWQVRPKRAWTPSTLTVGYREPLLVAGDRVLVHIDDYGSGIGVCTLLDTATGQVIATTEPGPHARKAIVGPGRFLVGSQGYGSFSSTLYDHAGRPAQTWRTHGLMVVDEQGVIRGPESDNSSARSQFRVLDPDGSMREGPDLTGYYTACPALDADGTTVFWRKGALVTVDRELDRRDLYTTTDDRAVMSRVLLLGAGTVAFALDDQLLIFRDTGLAPLAAGPWPCADGNLRGNPVLVV